MPNDAHAFWLRAPGAGEIRRVPLPRRVTGMLEAESGFNDAPDPAPDRLTVLDDVDRARADLAALAEAGIDLDEITAELERAGVQQFADAYAQMLEAITRKRQRIAVS